MGNNRVINVEVALPSGSQMRFSAIPEISNANSSYLILVFFISVDVISGVICKNTTFNVIWHKKDLILIRNFRDINVEVTLPTESQLRFSAIPEFSNANLTY